MNVYAYYFDISKEKIIFYAKLKVIEFNLFFKNYQILRFLAVDEEGTKHMNDYPGSWSGIIFFTRPLSSKRIKQTEELIIRKLYK